MKFINLKLWLIFSLLTGCQAVSIPETPSTPENSSVSESQLTLSNAILEQANPLGKTLWRIKSVQTTYSPDRKVGYLDDVTGNFWENQELAIYLSATKGQVIDDGKTIILTDNVMIRDVRNQTIITADELTWYPEQNLIILTANLTGQHPQFNVTSTMGKYHTDTQELELIGDIVGYSQESSVKFTSNQLFWKIDEQKILVNAPVEIVRYNQDEVIIDKIVAQKLAIDLELHQAKFKGNVEFISLEPAVQIASNSIIWNYQERTIIADEPVKLIHHDEKITLNANHGEINLVTEVAHLSQGVQGITPRNQANLYASDLIWSMNTQIIEARGNVIYEQVEPYVHLTGDKMVGNIQDNQIVVSSEQDNQIVTDIILDPVATE
jgi:LPS export ABC transporter protein LptC